MHGRHEMPHAETWPPQHHDPSWGEMVVVERHSAPNVGKPIQVLNY